jgi:hypothetical protein
VRAWSASRHAIASSNPTYTASFRRSQHPWCEECHAASGADAVGCAACHLDADGDELVGGTPSWRAERVHRIRPRDPDAGVCDGCHQFRFPRPSALDAALILSPKGPALDVPRGGHPAAFTDTALQDTVAEWAASAAASDTPCTDCHDPHTAPGAHDVERLRDAVSATVALDGDRVRATITATGAAHAVPTGDPYRRLRLTICPPERCEVPFASHDLERQFDRQGDDWVLVSDTRIPPATDGDSASVVVLLPIDVPLPPGTRWRLFYHYADPRHEPELPHEEVRALLAEGVLVPGDREPR